MSKKQLIHQKKIFGKDSTNKRLNSQAADKQTLKKRETKILTEKWEKDVNRNPHTHKQDIKSGT